MVKPPFRAVAENPVRIDANGNPFVLTTSEEQQFLQTAAPTSAVHGNPGFEDETGGVPDVWDFFWAAGTTEVEVETTVVYSGERALRVHVEAGGGQQVVLSDTFDVAGGDRIDLAVFACEDEGDPKITLGVLTGTSGTPVFLDVDYTNNESAPTSVASTWQMYQRQAVVPGGHTKARLFFRVAPGDEEACTVYLDFSTSAVTAGDQPDSGWQRPGDLGGPTWGTSWADHDSTSNELVVVRKYGGTVFVRGLAKRTSGAATTILTLPEESWPARLTARPAIYNEVGNTVYVTAAGEVTMSGSAAYANNQGVAFEFQFDTDQP